MRQRKVRDEIYKVREMRKGKKQKQKKWYESQKCIGREEEERERGMKWGPTES